MTTEFDKAKVLERVRKMMALANDAAASEGERDNAMRMAHATLAKYNLSMAEADAAGGKPEERGSSVIETRSRPWIRHCAQAIGQLFFCEYFYVPMGNNKMKSYFVGKESNTLTAVSIMQHVVQSILKEGATRCRVEGHDIAWRVSFQKGATARIRARCQQLRAEAEKANAPAAGTPGTALVLASVYALEKQANERFIAENVGPLRTSKSRETAPGSGYYEGREYGDTVGLHRQVGDTRTKGLLR